MFNFWTVLYLIFIGLVAGYAARLLVKGDDPMTWWQTMLLGVVGSFIGGFGCRVDIAPFYSVGTRTRASSSRAAWSSRSSAPSLRCSSGA